LGIKVLATSPRSSGERPTSRDTLQHDSGTEPVASDLDKAAPVSKGERHLRIAERLVLTSGIILFCFLVARLGADNILANLRMVGWGILLIIAAEILSFLANTLGWRAAFSSQETVPSFGQLLLARIAGDGVNYLTPTATMGGEFVRVRMLQGQAPVPSLAASVLVAKLTQTVGLLVFVSCGLLAVIDELRLPSSVNWGILASLVAFAAIVGGLLFLQRRSLLTPALDFAVRRLRLKFLARFRPPLEQLDAEMARVHRESSFRIFLSVGIFALGFAQGIIDTYLIIWFFGIPVSLKLAMAIEVLRVVLNNLTFFVPLRAGTQEAGQALAFAMLGLSAAQGLAAGVIYRVRELAWAFIGLAIMACSRVSLRSIPRSLETSMHLTSPARAKDKHDKMAA
jgi:glycosyltransferase 2 family protein